MKIKDIISCLESRAPLSYQESYDNAGLLTGDPEWEVKNALLTLDVTEAVIAEAAEKGCNLVIAHHPVIWKGLKKLNGKNPVERVVINAIRQEIAIYAAHTNLDNVRQGVNDMICERLELENRRILAPLHGMLRKLYTFVPHAEAEQVRAALFEAGGGHIGRYSECSFNAEGNGTFRGEAGTHPFAGQPGIRHTEPETRIEMIYPAPLEGKLLQALFKNHPYEEVAYDIVTLANDHGGLGAGMTGELPRPMEENEFLHYLKDRMETACIRHTPLLGKPVKKIAVCGGAGSFLLPKAISAGASVFVSADFKYHEFFDADSQIVIADIGHYESEHFTIELFYRLLTGKFPNFAPLKSCVLTNPINYLH